MSRLQKTFENVLTNVDVAPGVGWRRTGERLRPGSWAMPWPWDAENDRLGLVVGIDVDSIPVGWPRDVWVLWSTT